MQQARATAPDRCQRQHDKSMKLKKKKKKTTHRGKETGITERCENILLGLILDLDVTPAEKRSGITQ